MPTPLPPPTVEGARHGHVEPTEFETFCAREHARLARALSLALDNRELGRDAAAEALTRAFERWDEVRLHANLTGWAYRVGLNWGRSRLRRRRREVSVVLVPERPRPAPEIDDGVARALARLSTDHRAVVVGRYYLDWSEADVAAALDIPPGTVKSRLSRALAQLEQHLEHDDA
ncbi:MAG: sigma-70 family RNA polymerase sigma factor [Ilumatobacter sp.]|uniref:RNA polymerase sigma factor n=1 Tax=Ilumatobacter sp. TaxID=1967498 RepID=UPI0026217DC6|nr:sigma-70 family RNA polymerase sigma factor [Ilumatobacter sp.]MDJ0768075.1 sigma-70 family RNA polymerase sigma factor [Ilumatobacter sp.]